MIGLKNIGAEIRHAAEAELDRARVIRRRVGDEGALLDDSRERVAVDRAAVERRVASEDAVANARGGCRKEHRAADASAEVKRARRSVAELESADRAAVCRSAAHGQDRGRETCARDGGVAGVANGDQRESLSFKNDGAGVVARSHAHGCASGRCRDGGLNAGVAAAADDELAGAVVRNAVAVEIAHAARGDFAGVDCFVAVAVGAFARGEVAGVDRPIVVTVSRGAGGDFAAVENDVSVAITACRNSCVLESEADSAVRALRRTDGSRRDDVDSQRAVKGKSVERSDRERLHCMVGRGGAVVAVGDKEILLRPTVDRHRDEFAGEIEIGDRINAELDRPAVGMGKRIEGVSNREAVAKWREQRAVGVDQNRAFANVGHEIAIAIQKCA